MTWWHFFNVSALMFAPAYCIYMAKLQKEGPFGIVTFSGFFYALTELARVLLLGVLGLGTSGEPTSFALGTELLNVLLSALTVVGVWAALNHKFNATMKMLEFEQRIVCVALGFSVVQSVMHYGPALWIDARGPEFDWRFVRMGVQANIDLLLHLAFTAAVFVAKERFAKGQAVPPVAVGIVGVCLLVPSVMCFLTFVIGLPLTAVFATRAAVAAVAALAARAVYQQFEHSRKSDAQKK